MKISDIFRKIADVIDQEQDPGQPDAQLQNPAELSHVSAGEPVDNVDNQDAGADDDIMIPPLQLKTELLKRAVGVDNVYDDQRANEVGGDDCGCADDEIARMKQMAGIPVAAVSEMSDDLLDN
jgi:hypothetical protein